MQLNHCYAFASNETRWARTLGWKVTSTFDPAATAEIKDADEGPLAGRRVAVKDNIMVAGLPMMNGSATVEGFDLRAQPVEVRRALGYVPEKCPFYGEMTPRWFLQFVCDVRGINGNSYKPEIERVAAISSLQGVMDRRIETLSKGFQRRLGLAQSLLGDPPILILDEPMSGLDPNQKQEIIELIRFMAADKCFIISTHVMEELETICNRAILISKGNIVADSTPQDFKEKGHGKIDAFFRKVTNGA